MGNVKFGESGGSVVRKTICRCIFISCVAIDGKTKCINFASRTNDWRGTNW